MANEDEIQQHNARVIARAFTHEQKIKKPEPCPVCGNLTSEKGQACVACTLSALRRSGWSI